LRSLRERFNYKGKFEKIKSMKLKTITLNCFDSPLSLNRVERIHCLAKELLALKPDIICLQEITFSKTAKKLENFFSSSGYSVSSNTDLMINKGGLFIATKLPISESVFERFKNQGPFLSLQFTDRILGKGFQKVTMKTNGGQILLLNVHLASVYEKNADKEKETLKDQFAQLVNAIKSKNGEIIVCGDFNFSPKNQLYSEFLKMTKLQDSSKNSNLITVSKYNTNRQGLYKNGENLKLDYIFLSNKLSSGSRSQVIFDSLYDLRNKQIHLSDHFGLVTRLNV